ncbi:BRO family protein [Aetokthonos hydrillicola Thurmond2011]|jgi:prophage antirepressor-like protein|uniref:BRO family protein n=1 Tax=Aetokthonos hydrillicola Thurmond2011 TaxID=2712845 RepID=A0AAP5M5J9_9CYAN|nr:BRO family protein [Aetokthonos hydrillicola]MBO3463118.1 hypothetical protein [Aetokthonos hydrillicola CCALA 1050]MBW4591098.1 hypothetical protein [Aetokthonos hydrillicola CCALA 1050]MDR9893240.1 BRO family protein [Aetokthonos hydrillicola Thurmond2011]
MSNLTVFEFETHEVRFVGTADDPWWVAADVCTILGITVSLAVNGRERKAKDGSIRHDGGLDQDEKGIAIVNTPGGDQEMLVVNEPGLYRLIFKSRKPIARRFQRWVYHEVLPSIRKTGKYEIESQAITQPITQPTPPQLPASPEEICQVIDLMYGQVDEKLKRQVKAKAIARQHPRHAVTMEIILGESSVPIEEELVRPTLLGEKIQAKTGEKWSAIRVNKALVDVYWEVAKFTSR